MSASNLVLGRGLACGATDCDGLRYQALAWDDVAAVCTDAIAAVGHALLCLLDVEQPRPINLDLGEAQVTETLDLGLVGVALDLVILRLQSGYDFGGSAANFIESAALHGPELIGQEIAVHIGQFHGDLTGGWKERGRASLLVRSPGATG